MSDTPQKPHSDAPLLPAQSDDLFGPKFWEAVEETIATGQAQRKSIELPLELLEEVIARPISQAEIDHLQQIHAYLIITDGSKPVYEPTGPATLVRASSGWLIHDHGNYLSASAGLYAYGFHPDVLKQKAINDPDEEDEGGSRRREVKIDYSQTGTIVQQIADTARDMVGLIQNRWPCVKILEGFPAMQRMAWVVAQLNEYSVVDFDPSIADRVVLEWARRNGADKLRLRDLLAERRGSRVPGRPGRNPMR